MRTNKEIGEIVRFNNLCFDMFTVDTKIAKGYKNVAKL